MLKLSALQPHLTAADALNQRGAWAQGQRYTDKLCQFDRENVRKTCWCGADSLHQLMQPLCVHRAPKESSQYSNATNRHVRTQDWYAQGQELTGAQQPKRQLSVCIQLEVKLAEALDRCDSLSPPQADDHGRLLPNKLRTAVCCKVCKQTRLLG